MKQVVTVIGPNLSGGFDVHEASCGDIERNRDYRGLERFTIHALTRLDVAAETYDFLEEDELPAVLGEFRFAPCVELEAS